MLAPVRTWGPSTIRALTSALSIALTSLLLDAQKQAHGLYMTAYHGDVCVHNGKCCLPAAEDIASLFNTKPSGKPSPEPSSHPGYSLLWQTSNPKLI